MDDFGYDFGYAGYEYEYPQSNGKILRPMSRPDNNSPYGNVLLFKASKQDYPDIEDAYLDRMKGWHPESYKKASKAIGDTVLYRANGKSVKDIEKFLTVYNGYDCKLLEASENLGYDGYHYTYLKWAKITKEKATKEKVSKEEVSKNE